MKKNTGFSLLEWMIVVAVVAVIALTAVSLGQPIIKFFQRNPAQQQANLELRRCIETMAQALSNGRATTLVVSTPSIVPPVQNSSIQFLGVDGSTYTIVLSTTPSQSIHLERTISGGVTNDSILSTHAINLQFSTSSMDPGVVTILLAMAFPLDANTMTTVLWPTQTIRMMAN